MMVIFDPESARERVASPPAGTALARATRLCLPGHVRDGRDLIRYMEEVLKYWSKWPNLKLPALCPE